METNKIKVFILEDYEYKLQDIVDCLIGEFGDNIEIRCRNYFNEALNALNDEDFVFDFAIMDNNVPRFSDSYELVPNAAESAISWLELMGIPTKCIICSSDVVKLEEEHDNCIGIIKYSSISLDWTKELIKLIKL